MSVGVITERSRLIVGLIEKVAQGLWAPWKIQYTKDKGGNGVRAKGNWGRDTEQEVIVGESRSAQILESTDMGARVVGI